MSGTTEAFARVKIDALLQDAGWNLTDGSTVLFEYAFPDGTQADHVLCDRQGRPMGVLEAKRASIDPVAARDQGRHYAEQLGVPFVFLSTGEEVRFLDCEIDTHARIIAGFYAQDDLERRMAARRVRRELSTVAINRKIVDRGYQTECIEALCAEVSCGRRKLLVETATGTGKTRTAAAFIKRLFEVGIVSRVLFLVHRIALARQAEDAFTNHPRDYPCHVLRPGRGFDRDKRVTVATLQTMIAQYRPLCTVDADALPNPEDGLFVCDTLRFFEATEPTFRLIALAPGTSGSMKNISQAHLKTLSILVSPIDEPRRFAKVVAFARTASKLGGFGSNSALPLNATLMSRLLGAGV